MKRKSDYPESDEEARRILKAFESAATRSDREVSDSVAQHSLKYSTILQDERWLGSDKEELDWYCGHTLFQTSSYISLVMLQRRSTFTPKFS